jgi:hypothetical protein
MVARSLCFLERAVILMALATVHKYLRPRPPIEGSQPYEAEHLRLSAANRQAASTPLDLATWVAIASMSAGDRQS